MPGKQWNPQHPAPQQQFNSHITNTDKPDEEGHGTVSCRIDQGELTIKAFTEELSFPMQELKAASTATTSS